ncbi:hypothetical protein HA402_012726 [Bradysia odoriphaga]|nr:hypothetical protein HA402_012726 [Bradysia odoriphaga]
MSEKETNENELNDNGLTDSESIISTSGDGVSTAIAGHPTAFVVNASDCKGNVKCGLYVAFDGPEKPQIEFEHLKNGNICVTYLPSAAGEYTLTVKYNDRHVRGSPFHTTVICHGVPCIKSVRRKRNIVRKIKLTGLQVVPVNETAELYLDISHAEMNFDGELMVDITGPMLPQYTAVENSKGIVTLAYTPTKKGEYEFTLRFHGEHVPNSPYTVIAE